MVKIWVGSIVCGKSGKPMKVISIDGDGVWLQPESASSPDQDMVKVTHSAILRVITAPSL